MVETKNNFLFRHRTPKLSDIELIALSLTGEFFGIDSESQLFRIMPSYLKSKIKRNVYNRRRKRLFFHTERLRKLLVDLVSAEAEYFIVDSMPVEICRLSRCLHSSVCRDRQETAPDKGYCASQHMWYYGYKLHAVCSLAGVIHNYDLSKASVHDIYYLNDIKQVHHDCVLLGDRGYLGSAYQLDLFETANTRLKYRCVEINIIFGHNSVCSGVSVNGSKPFFHNCATNL